MRKGMKVRKVGKEYMEKLRSEEAEWRQKYLTGTPERKKEFTTDSGIPVKVAYTPLDLEKTKFDYAKDLGFLVNIPSQEGETR
jgi:hypothetical protein